MCGCLQDISRTGRMVLISHQVTRSSSESTVSMNIVASASVFLRGARLWKATKINKYKFGKYFIFFVLCISK